jgi:hypothetical protein
MKQNLYLAKLLFVLLLISSASNLNAQSTSWKGTFNDFWSNVNNWTNGVPDSNKHAIIGDANFIGAFQPKVNTTSYCLSLTLGGSVPVTLNSLRALHVKGDLLINPNGAIDHQNSTIYLKGNWINNGTYTTYFNGSRIICNGTSQAFAGTSPSVFRRLTINAGSMISLQTDISVTGTGSILAVYGEVDPGMSPTYKISSTGPSRIYTDGRLKINAATFNANYDFTGSVTWYSGAIAEYSSTVTDQVISSAYSYSTLMISGTGVKSLAANLPAIYAKNNPNGKIIVSSGTFDMGIYTANRGTTVAGGTLSVADGAVLKLSGASNFPINFATRDLSLNSLTEYNGAAQTISAQSYGDLVLSGSGIKTATTSFTVKGDFTIAAGTLNTAAVAVTHNLEGNFNMTGGAITGTNGTFRMSGTGDQSISLLSNPVHLSVDKISGIVNLASDITVTGTLGFSKGNIHTGNYHLTASGTVSGADQSTGWVYGNLRKPIATGASVSRSFEVGTATAYSPATVAFTNVSVAGSLAVKAREYDHEELSYSGIDSSKSVNEVWSFSNASTVFSSADITFNWQSSETDGGADATVFKTGLFNGSAWMLPAIQSPLPTAITATGITSFGEYAVGEKVQIIKWTGNNMTSDWFTPKNWFGGVPDGTTDILIPDGISGGRLYPILTGSTGSVKNIEVENTATLVVDDGTLQVSGTVSSANDINASNGTIEFNGNSAQSFDGDEFAGNSIKNLIISNDVNLTNTHTITGTLSVADGKTFETNDNLVLKSDATGTARVATLPDDGSGNATAFINGTVSIERYIPARKAWRLLTMPVKSASAPTLNDAWQEGTFGMSLAPNPNPGYGIHITGGTLANGFDQSPTNSASIKYYNNATNQFTALPPAPGTLINATDYAGYMIYIRGDRSIDLMQGVNAAITATTLRIKGEVKTGSQVVNVNAANFTLMGNPYPSAIDFGTLTRSNVKNSFYIWDPKLGGTNGLGAYVTVSWNSGTGDYDVTGASSPISRYIPSGEAVLIESADGTNPGTLTIKETDKTSNGSDQLFGRKNLLGKSIRINLFSLNNGATALLDGSLTTYHDNNANTVDKEDARKLNGSAETVAFIREGNTLAIERRKTIASNDTSFVYLAQMKKQSYRFEISAQNMGNTNMIAVLKDNYAAANNNMPLDLQGTTTVDFSINNDPASFAANRFSIVFIANPVAQQAPLTAKGSNSSVTSTESLVKEQAIAQPSVTVFPNPVTGNTISVKFNKLPAGTYRLQLLNANGQPVMVKSVQHNGLDAIQQMVISKAIAAGNYELKVEGEGKQFITPVVRQ